MATYWEKSCSFGLRYVSWYKYLIVSLVFSHLGFWSGNLFLIAPFPDLCLLVPFYSNIEKNSIDSSNNNKRNFWKIIRYFVKSNSSSSNIPPLITDENGHRQNHVTDTENANCLNTYFSSISTVPDSTPELPAFHLKTNKKLETFQITEQEVYDIIYP